MREWDAWLGECQPTRECAAHSSTHFVLFCAASCAKFYLWSRVEFHSRGGATAWTRVAALRREREKCEYENNNNNLKHAHTYKVLSLSWVQFAQCLALDGGVLLWRRSHRLFVRRFFWNINKGSWQIFSPLQLLLCHRQSGAPLATSHEREFFISP